MAGKELQISDARIAPGTCFYRYDGYSVGKIIECVYDGNEYWRSRYVRERGASTPQKAAEIGAMAARSYNGRRKVGRALARFIHSRKR